VRYDLTQEVYEDFRCPACGLVKEHVATYVIGDTGIRAVACRNCLDLLIYLFHLEAFLRIAVGHAGL
jgi:transcription elongation factor Elf1